MKLSDFQTGQRVKTHPATDAWMRGDRYGIVERVGGRWIYVRLDSGRLQRFAPALIEILPEWQFVPRPDATWPQTRRR